MDTYVEKTRQEWPQQKRWDDKYKEGYHQHWDKPSKSVKKFLSDFQNEIRYEYVLEIGCGQGRNLIAVAGIKAFPYGFDFSPEAIFQAQSILINELDIATNLKVASYKEKFPYRDNFFKATFSNCSLQNTTFKEAQFVFSEINRILMPNGLFHLNIKSRPNIKKKENPDITTAQVLEIENKKLEEYKNPQSDITLLFFTKEIIEKLTQGLFKIESCDEEICDCPERTIGKRGRISCVLRKI